ncbi:hypothetical protein PVAP13_8KG083684 [Panicum virgatum]|uniref:Uncharacterized protein n=1 Tax=Panicum virgatum TaxID=38727 RepID=A0A8T0PJD2_PANVG|nr:hypothetical protein PVAP13_8KG083684 [Panicum virgatum]
MGSASRRPLFARWTGTIFFNDMATLSCLLLARKSRTRRRRFTHSATPPRRHPVAEPPSHRAAIPCDPPSRAPIPLSLRAADTPSARAAPPLRPRCAGPPRPRRTGLRRPRPGRAPVRLSRSGHTTPARPGRAPAAPRRPSYTAWPATGASPTRGGPRPDSGRPSRRRRAPPNGRRG